MSRDAVLSYATPRYSPAGRVNRLAVFSFLWTFGVSLPASLLFCYALGGASSAVPNVAFIGLAVLLLVGLPAVGLVSAVAATERGAPWDSGYRWTALAVWAAPAATIMTSVGAVAWMTEWIR